MNKIILLIGKSGSGKSTIAEVLETKYGLEQIRSYTTRPKREEYEEGHTFVDEEEFEKVTKEEKIVAYTEYDGNKYCATEKQVSEKDVYIIDPRGIDYFKTNYEGKKSILIVYIKSDEITRINRMKSRGDTAEQILSRIETDKKEFQQIEEKADSIIENNSKDNIDVLARKIWLKFIE